MGETAALGILHDVERASRIVELARAVANYVSCAESAESRRRTVYRVSRPGDEQHRAGHAQINSPGQINPRSPLSDTRNACAERPNQRRKLALRRHTASFSGNHKVSRDFCIGP